MKKSEKREIEVALYSLNVLLNEEKKQIKAVEKAVAMFPKMDSPEKLFPALYLRASYLEAAVSILNKLINYMR